MNLERRQQIEALFDAALERPTAERHAYLETASAGDPELLAEVQALLAANELAEHLFDDTAKAPTGSIGPYRVIREIGRGGMGTVHLAERADGQYRRRVAIKLIGATRVDDPLHQRFLAERQILAGLDHPNIARLLDGGMTEDGRPYLVLEYVDGLPITTYCDRHRLGIDERLRLFVDVCDAVQHAHQNLVIHRDLKPGNILVTPTGQVRLLDFGIAKLLNPALSAAYAPVTQFDLRVMTPEYASPEQVRGDSITTASDIYSLGVLLYELLTGSSPYRLSTRSPAEIVASVYGQDPERPSTRVTRVDSVSEAGGAAEITPDQRGAARGTSVERLRRRLQGDLDSIVLMALRKEPLRRYASADLLRQDVQRYLEGLPVLAHRGSRRYRIGKLMRRHRGESLAALLILVALLAGAGVATWQASLAHRALQRAERERGTAELALRQSEAVTEFLTGLFEASDPVLARGDSITARELLERGVLRVEALADEPAVQVRMLDVMGRVYQNLGNFPRAEALLTRALEIQAGRHGRDHPEMVLPLTHLADVLLRRARFDDARSLLEEALGIQLRVHGPSDPEVARTLHELSRVAVGGGQVTEAVRLAREALDLRRRVLGPDHSLTAASATHLARVLRDHGDYAAAETVLRESIALHEQNGSAAASAVPHLLELADLLQHDHRDSGQAESLYRRALAELDATPRPDATQHVHALGGLARILEGRRDLTAAESLHRQGIEIRRKSYGSEHPFVSAGLIHLAGFYERTSRLPEAERLFREVSEIDRTLYGEDHPTRAGTLSAVARTLIAQGRLDEADAMLEEVGRIRLARLGPGHPLVGRNFYWQGEVQLRRGNHAAADVLFRRALAITQGQSAPSSNSVKEILGKLVIVNEALGRPAAAAQYRELTEQLPVAAEQQRPAGRSAPGGR
jgi:eukaryotic-like serine/threonine-protein kinase